MRILPILLVLMLAACIQVQQAPPAETAPAPAPAAPTPTAPAAPPAPVVTETTEPIPEPEPAPAPEPVQQLDSEIQAIIGLSETKTKSVIYNFLGPNDIGPGHKFFVRGNKIKIERQRPLELRDKVNYFDVVFLDTSSMTAIAYCFDVYGKKDCIDSKGKFPASYDEHFRPLPTDWISEIEPNAKITGAQQFSKRDVKRIVFDRNGAEWVMFLDRTYGLPVYILMPNGDEYKYYNLMGNVVLESEVTPPSD